MLPQAVPKHDLSQLYASEEGSHGVMSEGHPSTITEHARHPAITVFPVC